MFYLILAIISSAFISLVVRISEKHTQDGIAALTVNYIVCSLLAACYTGVENLLPHGEGVHIVLLLGLIGGILYMGSFLLMRFNIAKNGVVLSTTFMKLGVLVPTVLSIAAFHESPGMFQLLGLIAALAAIFLIHFEKNGQNASRKGVLLLLLFLSGGADALSKIYEQIGPSDLKDCFLFYIFLFALFFCALVLLSRKGKITRTDLAAGFFIGIPNYYSARFLLLSLSKIPAIVAYPVYSIGTIVAVLLIGVLLFHEAVSKKQKAALLLVFAALALLNLE